MISKIAGRLALYEADNGFIATDEINVYCYGYILLIENAINLMLAILFGCLLHTVGEVILFLALFIPLRRYAGGYHFDKAWKCILSTNVMIIIATVIAYNYGEYFTAFFWMPVEIIAGVIIYIMAPVDTKSKPLSDKEKEIFRRITRFVFCVEVAVGGIFMYIELQKYAFIGAMAHIALGIMICAGEYANKKIRRS